MPRQSPDLWHIFARSDGMRLARLRPHGFMPPLGYLLHLVGHLLCIFSSLLLLDRGAGTLPRYACRATRVSTGFAPAPCGYRQDDRFLALSNIVVELDSMASLALRGRAMGL